MGSLCSGSSLSLQFDNQVLLDLFGRGILGGSASGDPQRTEISVSLIVGGGGIKEQGFRLEALLANQLPEGETGFSTLPLSTGPLNSCLSTNWSVP